MADLFLTDPHGSILAGLRVKKQSVRVRWSEH